jgi:DNA polymerase III alpha subunit
MEALPLFKSHYSLGKSILTLENPEDAMEDGPDSIIDLCKKNDIKHFFLVDDNMSGFLQAYVNSKENDLQLSFGLRISVCSDMEKKEKDVSQKETCKYIILAKNVEGYKRLIKIFSLAAQKGFYHVPRIDFEHLKKLWNEKDLCLCVPFYDSFIHKNFLEGNHCIPDFSFAEPVFFIEKNDIPFDHLILKRVLEFTKNKYKTQKTKSIFYSEKKDFKAYLTFRCINKRSTLDKPQLDHMCSDEFCLEALR